jgi:enediyne biosynthesis thioesterase
MAIIETPAGRLYEYRHTTSFEETNVVGNVYFTNYLLWQGKCRELFLRDFAPEVLDQIEKGLVLVTLHVSCRYLSQLFALNEVSVRMRARSLTPNKVVMTFDYVRIDSGPEELVCQGEQGLAAMTMKEGRLVPTPFPDSLPTAIRSNGLLLEV